MTATVILSAEDMEVKNEYNTISIRPYDSGWHKYRIINAKSDPNNDKQIAFAEWDTDEFDPEERAFIKLEYYNVVQLIHENGDCAFFALKLPNAVLTSTFEDTEEFAVREPVTKRLYHITATGLLVHPRRFWLQDTDPDSPLRYYLGETPKGTAIYETYYTTYPCTLEKDAICNFLLTN